MTQRTTKRQKDELRPQAVDMAIYGDQWVAWSADGIRILSSGPTLEACISSAAALGYDRSEVVFDKIPPVRPKPPRPV